MKSKSRRELIEEIKLLKKNNHCLKEGINSAYRQAESIENEANKRVDKFRQGLMRLGADSGIIQAEVPNGHVVSMTNVPRGSCSMEDMCEMEIRNVKPVCLKGCVLVNPEEPQIENYVQHVLCDKLAEALFDEAMVKVEYETDYRSGHVFATGRVNVFPWYDISKRVRTGFDRSLMLAENMFGAK